MVPQSRLLFKEQLELLPKYMSLECRKPVNRASNLMQLAIHVNISYGNGKNRKSLRYLLPVTSQFRNLEPFLILYCTQKTYKKDMQRRA